MIRLAVRVKRAQAEVVLAELLELAPSGLEERDLGDVIEYAVYGAPGELPILADVRAAAGGALIEIATQELPDDWPERWKAFHVPIDIGTAQRRLRVRAPWHEPTAEGSDIVIDPGQAFGTGGHPTTRLCLELLIERSGAPGAVVDLGCGSGVLAIAAARLGFAPVLGLDHDPLAVAATIDNAAVNGVVVDARRHDLRHDGPAPSAPTMLANLLRPLLLTVAEAGFDGPPPQALVVGGLLVDECDEVAAAFARRGLREQERRTKGEWAALALGAG